MFYGHGSGFGAAGADYVPGYDFMNNVLALNGLFLQGRDANAFFARRVGGAVGAALAAGHFNEDGISDLAVGAPNATIKRNILGLFGSIDDTVVFEQAGAFRPVYGAASGIVESMGDYPLAFTQNYGFEKAKFLAGPQTPELGLRGRLESGDHFSASLIAGDFNGDGLDDLAIGVPGEDISVRVPIDPSNPLAGFREDTIVDAGAVNVMYSRGGYLWYSRSEDRLNRTDQFWHQFTNVDIVNTTGEVEASDRFGAVLTAGNFNNDRNPQTDRPLVDLVIGVPGEDDGRGLAHVLYGSPGELDGTEVPLVTPADQVIGDGAMTLATGDFNGDDHAELVIGQPLLSVEGPSAGSVSVVAFDSGAPQYQPPRWTQNEFSFAEQIEAGDAFGAAIATGDLNFDGHDDLLISVPGEDVPGPLGSIESPTFHQRPWVTQRAVQWRQWFGAWNAEPAGLVRRHDGTPQQCELPTLGGTCGATAPSSSMTAHKC